MTLSMQHLNKDTFIIVPFDYNNTCTIIFPLFFYGFIVLIGVVPSEITKFEFEKEKEMNAGS